MFDLNDFSGAHVSTRAGKRPRGRAGSERRGRGRYVKGPVPLDWLAAAGRMPSRALHVAVALAFLGGVARRHIELKLSYRLLADLGLDRHAAYRALNDLERGGLVTVTRAPGHSPVVSLLFPTDADDSETPERCPSTGDP